MSHARPGLTTCSQYDAALHALSAARQRWAETSVNRRLALLRQIKDARRHCPGVGGRGSGGQRVAGGRSAGGGGVAGGPLRANGRLQRAYRHPEQLEEKTFLRRIPLRTLADGRPGAAGGARHALGSAASVWCSR